MSVTVSPGQMMYIRYTIVYETEFEVVEADLQDAETDEDVGRAYLEAEGPFDYYSMKIATVEVI